jgi:hypothetical protein
VKNLCSTLLHAGRARVNRDLAKTFGPHDQPAGMPGIDSKTNQLFMEKPPQPDRLIFFSLDSARNASLYTS